MGLQQLTVRSLLVLLGLVQVHRVYSTWTLLPSLQPSTSLRPTAGTLLLNSSTNLTFFHDESPGSGPAKADNLRPKNGTTIPIVVISAPHSIRLAEFQETFRPYGSVIDVVNSTTESTLDNRVVYDKPFRGRDSKARILAVTHSHLKALEHANASRYEYAWIMEDDARLDYFQRYPAAYPPSVGEVLKQIMAAPGHDVTVLYCTTKKPRPVGGTNFQPHRMGDWGAVSYVVRVEPVLSRLRALYWTKDEKWDISSARHPVSDYVLYQGQRVKVWAPNVVSHGHPFSEHGTASQIHEGRVKEVSDSLWKASHEETLKHINETLKQKQAQSYLF